MTIENLINIENLFASLDFIKMHLGTVAASIFLSNFVIEDYLSKDKWYPKNI